MLNKRKGGETMAVEKHVKSIGKGKKKMTYSVTDDNRKRKGKFVSSPSSKKNAETERKLFFEKLILFSFNAQVKKTKTGG